MDTIAVITLITGFLFSPFAGAISPTPEKPQTVELRNCNMYFDSQGSGQLACLGDSSYDLCSAVEGTFTIYGDIPEYKKNVALPNLQGKKCLKLPDTLTLSKVQQLYPSSTYCALDRYPEEVDSFTPGIQRVSLKSPGDIWSYQKSKAIMANPYTNPLLAQTRSCNVVWY